MTQSFGEIFIRTKVDDVPLKEANKNFKDFNTQLKMLDYQYRQGKISADQFAKSMSDIARNANAAKLTIKQTVDLNASFYHVTERATTGFKSMGRSLKDAALPSMMEVSRIAQDMNYGIQGMANNVTQLANNFVYLKKEAGTTTAALKAMAGSLWGPAGIMLGISLLMSMLPKLIDLFSKTTAETKNLADATKKLADAQFQASNPYEQLRQMRSRQGIIQTMISASTPSATPGAARGIPYSYMPEAERVKLMAELVALTKQIYDIESKLDEKRRDSLGRLERTLDAIKVSNEAYGRFLDEQGAALHGRPVSGRGTSASGAARKLGSPSSGFGGYGSYGGFNISPMGGAEYQSPRVTFGEWMSYSMDFQSAFMSGIGSISSSISSQIGGAFASVFGGAKTLLGQFVNMFTQALAEMAMRAAAIFMFTSIFPSTGPFFGLGKPGQSTVGTDSGSIAVGLAQSRSRSNSLNVNIPQIAARIENDAIVLAYERGKNQRSLRTA